MVGGKIEFIQNRVQVGFHDDGDERVDSITRYLFTS
jgi:hypothetical protein